MGVGGLEEEVILVHGDAALPDVIAYGLAIVVPDLMSVAGVDGPDVVRRREVKNPVDDQRRGFDDAAAYAKGPGDAERVHVRGVDLVQGAVPAAGVVAVVGGPVVGRRLQKYGGIETLRGRPKGKKTREQHNHQRHKPQRFAERKLHE